MQPLYAAPPHVVPTSAPQVHVVNVLMFGAKPINTTCPNCRADVKSTTVTTPRTLAHLGCLALCLSGYFEILITEFNLMIDAFDFFFLTDSGSAAACHIALTPARRPNTLVPTARPSSASTMAEIGCDLVCFSVPPFAIEISLAT
jgi:hypothetical protein